MHTVMQLPQGPTEVDAARAEIYKNDVIMGHSVAGMLILSGVAAQC